VKARSFGSFESNGWCRLKWTACNRPRFWRGNPTEGELVKADKRDRQPAQAGLSREDGCSTDRPGRDPLRVAGCPVQQDHLVAGGNIW